MSKERLLTEEARVAIDSYLRKERSLKEGDRAAINSYLRKIAFVFGIPNLLVLLGGYIYLVNVVPGHAAQEARSQIQNEISVIYNSVLNESTAALKAVGAAEEKASAVANTAEKNVRYQISQANELIRNVEVEIAKVEGQVEALSGVSLEDAAAVAEVLANDPKTDKLISSLGMYLNNVPRVIAAENGQLITPPRGTIDDWNALVVPQEFGLEEKDSEGDNSLLMAEFEARAADDSSKWKIVSRFKWRFGFGPTENLKNRNGKWKNAKSYVLLIPKTQPVAINTTSEGN